MITLLHPLNKFEVVTTNNTEHTHSLTKPAKKQTQSNSYVFLFLLKCWNKNFSFATKFFQAIYVSYFVMLLSEQTAWSRTVHTISTEAAEPFSPVYFMSKP